MKNLYLVTCNIVSVLTVYHYGKYCVDVIGSSIQEFLTFVMRPFSRASICTGKAFCKNKAMQR